MSKALFLATLALKISATGAVTYLFGYYLEYVTDVQLVHFEAMKVQTLLLDYPHRFYPIYFLNQVPEISNHHFFYLDLPRAYFMIKLVSLLNFATDGSYWLNSIWLSIGCFLVSWYLCFTVGYLFPAVFKPTIIAIFLVPNTVFWSSGLLKEALAFGLLASIIALFLRFTYGSKNPMLLLLAVLPAYLLFQVKFYVLGAFLLVAIPTGIVETFSKSIKNKGVIFISLMAFSCSYSTCYATLYLRSE